VIERQLAEASGSGPDKAEWKSGQVAGSRAQLFILCVNDVVWMPLMNFIRGAERALDDAQRPAELPKICEAWWLLAQEVR
jgi:hypothetical protein